MSLYMNICMYVDTHIHECMFVCEDGCMNKCRQICVYAWMDKYRQNCMNVCIYVCTDIYVHAYRR